MPLIVIFVIRTSPLTRPPGNIPAFSQSNNKRAPFSCTADDDAIYQMVDEGGNRWISHAEQQYGIPAADLKRLKSQVGVVSKSQKIETLRLWETRNQKSDDRAELIHMVENFTGKKIWKESMGNWSKAKVMRMISKNIPDELWNKFVRVELDLDENDIKSLQDRFSVFSREHKFRILRDWFLSGEMQFGMRRNEYHDNSGCCFSRVGLAEEKIDGRLTFSQQSAFEALNSHLDQDQNKICYFLNVYQEKMTERTRARLQKCGFKPDRSLLSQCIYDFIGSIPLCDRPGFFQKMGVQPQSEVLPGSLMLDEEFDSLLGWWSRTKSDLPDEELEELKGRADEFVSRFKNCAG